MAATWQFLSTPSARRATPASVGFAVAVSHFYPRPPRGGRPSIRERCSGCSDFYPRPPRGGRRTNRPLHSRRWYFYPRPPRGGRRTRGKGHRPHRLNFYPRPPRGGRPAPGKGHHRRSDISIHALREEGDAAICLKVFCPVYFYPRPPRGGRLSESLPPVRLSIFLSTPSARRATREVRRGAGWRAISIHALREEGDSKNRDKISIFKQIIQHSARI